MKILVILIIGFCVLSILYFTKKNKIETFFGFSNRPIIINRYVTIALPDGNINYSSPALVNSALGIKKQNYTDFSKNEFYKDALVYTGKKNQQLNTQWLISSNGGTSSTSVKIYNPNLNVYLGGNKDMVYVTTTYDSFCDWNISHKYSQYYTIKNNKTNLYLNSTKPNKYNTFVKQKTSNYYDYGIVSCGSNSQKFFILPSPPILYNSSYSNSLDKAVAFCNKQDKQLCSKQDLNVAYQLGYSACACSWTRTKSGNKYFVGYPMSYNTPGCGSRGVNTCIWQSPNGGGAIMCCPKFQSIDNYKIDFQNEGWYIDSQWKTRLSNGNGGVGYTKIWPFFINMLFSKEVGYSVNAKIINNSNNSVNTGNGMIFNGKKINNKQFRLTVVFSNNGSYVNQYVDLDFISKDYEKIGNKDCNATEITNFTGESTECFRACSSNNKCNGVSYNPKTKQCSLKSNTCDITNINNGSVHYKHKNSWYLPSWNACGVDWKNKLGWPGLTCVKRTNMAYKKQPTIGQEMSCDKIINMLNDNNNNFHFSWNPDDRIDGGSPVYVNKTEGKPYKSNSSKCNYVDKCGNKKTFWNFSNYSDTGMGSNVNCKLECLRRNNCDAYLTNPSNNQCYLYNFKPGNISSYRCGSGFKNGRFYGDIKKSAKTEIVEQLVCDNNYTNVKDCYRAVDKWCQCNLPPPYNVQLKYGRKLPGLARQNQSMPQWRCYSKTSLTPDLKNFNNKSPNYWTIGNRLQKVWDKCQSKNNLTKIGCFKDNPDRALPLYYGTGYNAWTCAEKAKSVGSPYFGLQWPQGGTQCFVGNANTPYDQYGKTSNCSNNKGGVWANTVYKIKDMNPPNKPYTSLGCWKDVPNSRAITPAIPGYNYWNNVSVDECARKTKAAGFSVFGSQYGGQCFASNNAQNTYSKYGRASNCSNGTGGANANNVYQIKK